jgi:hypothetical protein
LALWLALRRTPPNGALMIEVNRRLYMNEAIGERLISRSSVCTLAFCVMTSTVKSGRFTLSAG